MMEKIQQQCRTWTGILKTTCGILFVVGSLNACSTYQTSGKDDKTTITRTTTQSVITTKHNIVADATIDQSANNSTPSPSEYVIPAKAGIHLPENTSNSISKNSHPLPDGASQNWLAEAQKYIRESEYHIKPYSNPNVTGNKSQQFQNASTLFQAPNRAQNLRFFFEEDGIRAVQRDEKEDWEWGLTLISYGSSDNIQPVAQATKKTDSNRIEYQRGNITEWYVNNDQGLEQGFTIQQAPKDKYGNNAKDIIVEIEIEGNLQAHLYNNKITFHHPERGHKLNYNKLVAWDANNKILDANFKLIDNQIQIAVNTSNATYPIVIDPLTSSVANNKLKGDQSDAKFSLAVGDAGDINGDGYSDVIIGAPYYDTTDSNGALQSYAGAAFVYLGSPDGLSLLPLRIENYSATSTFGSSVTGGDINGDSYSDVIIGAPGYDVKDNNGNFIGINAGAAFVYFGSAAGLNMQPQRIDGDQSSSEFGISIASAGDINADGYADVVVGARSYDVIDNNGIALDKAGAAFVYLGGTNGLNTTAIRVESALADSYFGHTVAGAGDVNGDGYSDVVVGARYFNVNSSWLPANAGAAFVYLGHANGLDTAGQALIGFQSFAEFGSSVSSAGDINGDGYGDVLVGAYKHNTINSNGDTISSAGATFVYLGSASGVDNTQKLQLDGDQENEYFGSSVAASDINGDGYSDVVVGAQHYSTIDNNGVTLSDVGAAFVYLGGSSGLNMQPIRLDGNQSNSRFGRTITNAGDINGDGYRDILVGAWLYDNVDKNGAVLSNAGAAFVFLGNSTGLNSQPLQIDGDESNLRFGTSVASAGDVNNDGYSDVIVGAWLYDSFDIFGGVYDNSGGAFVYLGSANGLNTQPLRLEVFQSNTKFGWTVASAGDINDDGYSDVIVGAPSYDTTDSNGITQVDTGAAFIYFGRANGIDPTAQQLDGNQVDAWFGSSVASAGDVNGDGFSDVVVGAHDYDIPTNSGSVLSDAGAAFVYYGGVSGLSTQSQPLAAYQFGAEFGFSVASAGDINSDGYSDVLVGALWYDVINNNGSTVRNAGAAFVYLGSNNGLNTAAPQQLNGDQLDGFFGHSVASAGDINGDGYSDAIVGAYVYDTVDNNGTVLVNAGAAFVYLGSANGFNTPPHRLDGDQVDASFGTSVASAGDVNGDGFSDVIVGATKYDTIDSNGSLLLNTGAVFVYLGAANDFASPTQRLDGDQADALFGLTIANAGDINGDGYSDVVAGTQYYDTIDSNGSTLGFAGTAFVYSASASRMQKPIQRNTNNVFPAESAVIDELIIEMTAIPDSITGDSKVKLQVTACPLGVTFGDELCITTTSSIWTDVTLAGTVITLPIFPRDGPTHWRSRLLYAPVTTVPDNNLLSAVATPWLTQDAIADNVDVYFNYSANQAPTISGVPTSTSIPPNELFNFLPIADDLNLNDILTLSIVNKPSWMTFDTSTGQLTGIPTDTDFGTYDNIIITVEDDASPTKASASLASFSVTVVDIKAPNVIAITTIDPITGNVTYELTCFDAGSECSGPIYFTTDGVTPTSGSDVYDGPFTVASGTTVLTYSEDTEGNNSIIPANFISITAPSEGLIGEPGTFINGTIDEEFTTVSTVNIQVYGDNGTALVESGGAQSFLPSPPAFSYLNTTVNNAVNPVLIGDWQYNKTIPWVNDVQYTVTATATDTNGNTSTVTNTFTFFSGIPSATELLLGLTNNSILNGGQIDANLTLTKINDPLADLSDIPVKLHVTDPFGTVKTITNLSVNFAGQVTLSQLGSGAFGISFDQPGPWSLQAEFDNTNHPNLENVFSDPETLLVGSSAGYAVIVQGKLPNDDGLESHNKTANRIYDTLKNRGFVDSDIYYYNYDTNQSGVDGIPDKATIQASIEGLASEVDNRPAPVYVIFVDHGGKATESLTTRFFINDEIITPAELDSWLSTLEANMNLIDLQLAIDNPRVVIIGSCYSGGFISNVSATGRIIITSATEDEQSFKGPLEDDNIRVGEYFLEELFLELGGGNNLREAFKIATNNTETYTKEASGDVSTNADNEFLDTAVQHPLLDDDANNTGTNTIYENTTDGQIAKEIVLGFNQESLTNDAFNPADITSIGNTQYLANNISTANLELYANDPFQVNQAYVEIRSPQLTLSSAVESTTEQLSSNFIRRAFTPPVTDGAPYTLTYDSFDQPGKYEVYYYVNDRFTGALSPAKRGVIYRNRPDGGDANTAPYWVAADLLSPDDGGGIATGFTTASFDWDDAKDDNLDSVISYSFILADDGNFDSFMRDNGNGGCTQISRAYRQEELTSSSTFVDSQAKLCDLTSYVWKVEAVDEYGLVTASSNIFTYNTNDTNADIGVLVAMVKSSSTNAQLTTANIFNDQGETGTSSASVLYNGNYVLFTQNTGVVQKLSATVTGYVQGDIPDITIGSGETKEFLINLDPDATLDTDNDTIIDTSDNCPTISNTNQNDLDNDNLGDLCDSDIDGDGMSNDFETTYGLLPFDASDAVLDPDLDDQSNVTEFRNGTDPLVFTTPQIDTDGDGIFDVADNCINDFNFDQADMDNDKLGNVCDLDDDGDGMTDTFELLYSLNPLDPSDADTDPDGDGKTNLEEFNEGTSPNVSNASTTTTITAPATAGGGGGAINPWALLGLWLLMTAIRRQRKAFLAWFNAE